MQFEPRSVALLIAIGHGLLFAGLLLRVRQNRAANRYLALLLVLVAVSLVPSTIGFAGAYDRYRWLTFLPTSVALGFGPAIWLYARRLVRRDADRAWLHLLPLAVQLGYYTVAFCLPLDLKLQFARSVHWPWVLDVERVLSVVSGIAYWIVTFALVRRYSAWAPSSVSDSANYDLGWLRWFLILTAVGFATWAGFLAFDLLVRRLGYGAFFWLDLTAAVLAYAFALAGYHRSSLAWPPMNALPAPANHNEAASVDWSSRAAEVRRRVISEQWHLDPDLTLDVLAEHLSTNTWSLSRTINEGLGVNFNDFINGLRVEAVQRRLADPDDSATMLDIAFACGFNSKTSFNRSFRKLTGKTPSQWRRDQGVGIEDTDLARARS
ncbi:MAG: AraC family transcriptional regulator [Planctomycetota bacterium]